MENKDLAALFCPKSVALVGNPVEARDAWSQLYLNCLFSFKFDGRIYPVNPKGGEIWGLKVYPTITSIPDTVDYVISCVPARLTPQLMEEYAAKGVKLVTLFTAGFGEVGEDGATLESKVVQIARRDGVRVLGPNCMGIYYPKARLSISPDFPLESGKVGFICQSGGNSYRFVHQGIAQGLRFSKVISYGNACDIDETELLQYLAHDSETEIIAAYIEGVKDGRRFIEVLKEAANMKPVIILKAGRSSAGTRAALSHTAALTGDNTAWDALFKQTGVVQVYSIEELVNVVMTFLFFPLPKGRNVGLIGRGGGLSVEGADICEEAGLFLPRFPASIREKLRQFTPDTGNILINPVDSAWLFERLYLTKSTEELCETAKIVSSWKGIDFLLITLTPDNYPNLNDREFTESRLSDTTSGLINCSSKLSKPVAIVLHAGLSPEIFDILLSTQQKLISAGLPVYSSVIQAANAISKFIHYHENHAIAAEGDTGKRDY
jgi:acyl-CoA synthetase (NDP forming)